jgi:hypothetical protein
MLRKKRRLETIPTLYFREVTAILIAETAIRRGVGRSENGAKIGSAERGGSVTLGDIG